MSFTVEWRCQDRDYAGRDDGNRFLGFDSIEFDNEFISAKARKLDAAVVTRIESGDCICGPGAVLEPACDLLQQVVSNAMAERIVDTLESIEIDEQHCEFLILTFCRLNRSLQALAEELSIGQRRQLVVISEIENPRLGILAFRNVSYDGQNGIFVACYESGFEMNIESFQGVFVNLRFTRFQRCFNTGSRLVIIFTGVEVDLGCRRQGLYLLGVGGIPAA